MSLDLTLIPVNNLGISFDIVRVHPLSMELATALKHIPTTPHFREFEKVWSFKFYDEENRTGLATEDKYGDTLEFCYASDLRALEIPQLPQPARAYVKALDDNQKIILHWD